MKSPLNLFRSKGFTLIELLIVVAIIAILAAIAVPNFLEAQTRSKVSRVKSDMRTCATAIEAYYVDFNKYPRDAQYQGAFLSYLPRMAQLTTPISYMTSVPEDVFAINFVTAVPGETAPYKIPYNTGQLTRPYPFDFANRVYPSPYPTSPALAGTLEDPTFSFAWSRISSNPGVMWAMRSVGPDLKATVLGSLDNPKVYDPSNGTISDGDIFMTGPGIGFDKPKNG